MMASYGLMLQVDIGIIVALAFVWTTLLVALVGLRPKGGRRRQVA